MWAQSLYAFRPFIQSCSTSRPVCVFESVCGLTGLGRYCAGLSIGAVFRTVEGLIYGGRFLRRFSPVKIVRVRREMRLLYVVCHAGVPFPICSPPFLLPCYRRTRVRHSFVYLQGNSSSDSSLQRVPRRAWSGFNGWWHCRAGDCPRPSRRRRIRSRRQQQPEVSFADVRRLLTGESRAGSVCVDEPAVLVDHNQHHRQTDFVHRAHNGTISRCM